MLSNIKILPRLFIGFGMLVFMMAGLSGFAVISNQSSQSLFARVTHFTTAEAIDQRVVRQIFEGRMQIWMGLATGDQEHWAKADAAFQLADQRLEVLRADTLDPQSLAMAKQLQSMVGAFRVKESKLQEFKGKNGALETSEAKALTADAGAAAADIERIGDQLADSYAKAADGANASAVGQIAEAIDVAIIVGIVSVLLGAVVCGTPQ